MGDVIKLYPHFPVRSQATIPKPAAWRCACGRICLIALRYCPDCGKARPTTKERTIDER